MAETSYAQNSFLGGQWSPNAQGRFDDPRYRTAMNVCLNTIPVEAGAAVRRPGTRHASITRNGNAGREIKFDFQEMTPYKMEFTTGMLRFRVGADLVMTNDAQAVVSISTANPAKVATTTEHNWVTGNQVMFNTLGVNNPLLHNRQFLITKTSSTEFTLADPVTGATIDGSTLGTFVSGNVTRILEIVSPYVGVDLSAIRSVQTGKTAILLNGLYSPQVLTVTKMPTATTFAEFTLLPAVFIDGPYFDPVTGGATVTPSATSGIISLVVTFPTYSSSVVYTKGAFVLSSSVSYQSLVDQNLNNTPASSPTKWLVVKASIAVGPNGFLGTDIGRSVRLLDSASHWTWGRITGLLSMISGTLAGSAQIGDMTDSGGLSAAFDGNPSKVFASSATKQNDNFIASQAGLSVTGYVGKNYSGASAQAIQSGILYGSTDSGLVRLVTTTTTTMFALITVNMRAKATLPASASDGTLLGTYFIQSASFSGADVPINPGPITIQSNDTTTTWNYVWFEIVAVGENIGGATVHMYLYMAAGQAQFFSPAGAASDGINVEIIGPALASATAISTWRLGFFSDTDGWPTCGTYHEGRLWLSGSVGNRIDGSYSNRSLEFTPTAAAGTVSDANGIDYTFDAPDVNTIFWMEPDQQGIICGTQAGEWLVQASSQNNILTPTSIQAHRVTKIGCANIEPRRTEHTLVLVQKFGRKLIEYFADVYSGKFTAPNLSEKAKNLTKTNVQEIAYQQELAPIVWARRGDGTLVGATYKRDTLATSQGPTFVAWHQHTLGSGRTVEGICVGPSVDGNLDTLSMVTNDSVSLVRHVELLTDLFDEDGASTDAWFLDDAIVPSASVEATVAGKACLVLYGLWYLNGSTVTVFAGGLDVGDFVVSNGAVTVPYGSDDEGLFTSAFVATFAGAMPIVVGFTYTSRGQLVRPATQAESGTRAGPALGKTRRTHHFAALLNKTAGISFGTAFGKLNKQNFKTPGGTAYAKSTLFSGVYQSTLTDDYSLDSMIAWEVTRPYPANIAALSGFVQTQDQ